MLFRLPTTTIGQRRRTVSYDEPLTVWMKKLQLGDRDSAQRLWQVYYQKLVNLARQRLGGRTRLVSDEEDVVLSAFKSFCNGMENGRFPELDDRDGLWKLLVTITLHKVFRLVRNETRQKRGGNWKRSSGNSETGDDLLTELAASEPTPEVAAQFAEDLQRLLVKLESPELVELATLKMEGYTNAEIALRWNRAERTVEAQTGDDPQALGTRIRRNRPIVVVSKSVRGSLLP